MIKEPLSMQAYTFSFVNQQFYQIVLRSLKNLNLDLIKNAIKITCMKYINFPNFLLKNAKQFL